MLMYGSDYCQNAWLLIVTSIRVSTLISLFGAYWPDYMAPPRMKLRWPNSSVLYWARTLVDRCPPGDLSSMRLLNMIKYIRKSMLLSMLLNVASKNPVWHNWIEKWRLLFRGISDTVWNITDLRLQTLLDKSYQMLKRHYDDYQYRLRQRCFLRQYQRVGHTTILTKRPGYHITDSIYHRHVFS